MALENNGETHGYLWRDGIVRTTPEVDSPYTAADQHAAIALRNQAVEERGLPHVTQDTLDKAYAEWLKEYTRWKAAFAEWEQKHGKR